MCKQRFAPGQVVVTPGALDLQERRGILLRDLLSRHVCGDWGDLGAEDKQENEFSLAHGFRLLSAYRCGDEKVWIITERDRSVTTILLPSEY